MIAPHVPSQRGAPRGTQGVVTLAAGEVRAFVVQSTAAGAPSAANHKVVALLDNTF